MTEINWKLLQDLAVKPHPTLNSDYSCDCHNHCGEIVEEARAVSHLLDMAGVAPGTRVYDRYIDARVFLAVVEMNSLRDRLGRITTWHARETAEGGMVGDFCTECGERWPCDTRRMADGTHEDLADVASAAEVPDLLAEIAGLTIARDNAEAVEHEAHAEIRRLRGLLADARRTIQALVTP